MLKISNCPKEFAVTLFTSTQTQSVPIINPNINSLYYAVAQYIRQQYPLYLLTVQFCCIKHISIKQLVGVAPHTNNHETFYHHLIITNCNYCNSISPYPIHAEEGHNLRFLNQIVNVQPTVTALPRMVSVANRPHQPSLHVKSSMVKVARPRINVRIIVSRLMRPRISLLMVRRR